MAKKVLTQPPKGTRDFLPDEMRRRRHVVDVVRSVYEAHGFEPLETPSYERLDTLLGKYGDEGDQLVFKILHRGQPLVSGIRDAAALLEQPGAVVVGRSGETAPGAETLLADTGLRYDLTVPLARVVAEHQGKLPSPFKRYQIQPVWRADTPGKGRFREFYQCDVDVVGSTSRAVEAEVAGAVAACIDRLGFERFDIRINHRALLRALIEHAGIELALETPAIVAIDKLDKVSPEAVADELQEKGVPAAGARRLLELVTARPGLDELARELGDAPRAVEAIADLRRVLELGAATPAAAHLRFDLTLARGLGYYTGSIFEIAVPDLAGSLGGGGRYDDLIGMFLGRDVPACGFSIGLERILVVMEQRGMFPEGLAPADVLLACTDDAQLEALLGIAYRLRAAGLRVRMTPGKDKPGRIRKTADDAGIAHAVWLDRGEPAPIKVWRRSDGESFEATSESLLERLGV